MAWSKLKAKIEDRFATSLRKRVAIHMTSYHEAGWLEGRGWLLIDKEQLPLAATLPYGAPRASGEHDRPSLHAVLVAYLDLSLAGALASEEPIHRALAMIDRRLGRRRFEGLRLGDNEHPIVRQLYEVRAAAEEWRTSESPSAGGLTSA
jgi:hypothetical protein